MYTIDTLPGLIELGQQGESGANSVVFDISAWKALYPAGTYSITYTRPGETTVYPESAGALAVATVGLVTTLTWTPSDAVLDIAGQGSVVVHCTENGVEKRSAMTSTIVEAGHGAAGDPPEPLADYIEKWGAVDIAVTGLAEGAEPTGVVTQDGQGTHIELGIPKGDTGKPFNYRGDYNPDADPLYTKNDVVRFGGGSLVYINDVDSNEPTSSESHWQQIAEKGETGATGPTGPKGDTGDPTSSTASDIPTSTAGVSVQGALDKLSYVNGGLDYGVLPMPSGFPALPCTFYRDFDGLVKHNFGFTAYTGGTEIYVSATGNDTSGDGSEGNPYKTIGKAIDVINADGDTKYEIHLLSEIYLSGTLGTKTITDKTVAIIADTTSGKSVLTVSPAGLSWSADDNVWKATRSAVYSVYDYRQTDLYGVISGLTYVSTLSECKSTANTWYQDGTYVWVNTSDGTVPTESTIAVCINGTLAKITLLGTAKLYIQGVQFLTGSIANGVSFFGDITGSALVGSLVCKDCIFSGENQRLGGTVGVMTDDLDTVMFIDCIGSKAVDVFHHKATHVANENKRESLAVLYRCIAYDVGKSTSTTSNAFSAHNGMSTLRIGCIGYRTYGPVLADVNGCFSVCIDCHMRDSLIASGISKAAFYFDNAYAVANGKAYLINCDASGDNYSLNVDPAAFEVHLKSFKANNIKSGLTNIAVIP